MNKQKFNQVIKDRSRIGEEELIQLVELSNDYPYSQVIHTLVAKGTLNSKLPNYASKLQKAALYVTDRGVLKHVIEDTLPDYVASAEITRKPAKKVAPGAVKKVQQEKPQKTTQTKSSAKKAAVKPIQETKAVPTAKSAPTSKPKVETVPASKLDESKEQVRGTTIKPSGEGTKVNFKAPEKSISEIVLESLAEMKKAKELANLDDTPQQATSSEPSTKKPSKTSARSTAAKAPSKSTKATTSATPSRSRTTSAKKGTTEASSKTRQSGMTTAADKPKPATKTKNTAAKSATSTKKGSASTKASVKSAAPTKKSSTPTKASTKKSSTPSKASAKSADSTKKNTSTKASDKSRSKSTTKSSKSSTSKKKIIKSPKATGSDLIVTIKKSHKKQKDIGSKQQEQIEIINNFIKKGGSLKPSKTEDEVPPPTEDLSKRSTQFHENLISENLARILVRQKQYPKAIEIYKKLIWKFPQKKSYFADQIEEIKKL